MAAAPVRAASRSLPSLPSRPSEASLVNPFNDSSQEDDVMLVKAWMFGMDVQYRWKLDEQQRRALVDLALSSKVGGTDASFGDNGIAFSSSVLVVGASLEDSVPGSGDAAGVAYVFSIVGSGYSQSQRLASGAAGGYFGFQIALSSSALVIGALTESSTPSAGDRAGAVYVFTLSGTAYTQSQRLAGAPGSNLGSSVALSTSTLVVGARVDGSNEEGAVYVFKLINSAYSQCQRLHTGAYHGWFSVVALSSSLLAVGAVFENNYAGAVYVFTSVNQVYSQNQRITITATDGNFGGALVFASSNILVVSSPAEGKKTHTSCVLTVETSNSVQSLLSLFSFALLITLSAMAL